MDQYLWDIDVPIIKPSDVGSKLTYQCVLEPFSLLRLDRAGLQLLIHMALVSYLCRLLSNSINSEYRSAESTLFWYDSSNDPDPSFQSWNEMQLNSSVKARPSASASAEATRCLSFQTLAGCPRSRTMSQSSTCPTTSSGSPRSWIAAHSTRANMEGRVSACSALP